MYTSQFYNDYFLLLIILFSFIAKKFEVSKVVIKLQFDFHPFSTVVFLQYFFYFYHKIQVPVILKKQGDHTKANTSGEEAQKETMGLIDIGLPQSKK